ncbi:MAG TPA: DUF4411 family protein [Candidatus Saccharimonadales bacterium]
MAEAKSKPRIYIFDASVLLRLNRINETDFEIPQAIWDKFSELLDSGEIISQRYVYEEVVSNSDSPDKVSAWFKPYKSCCPIETADQVLFNSEIIKKFPGLIDPKREKEQADPWLIALARDLSSKDSEHEYVIVTQESKRSSTKIPAAANTYDIGTLTLREFLDEKKISLTVI